MNPRPILSDSSENDPHKDLSLGNVKKIKMVDLLKMFNVLINLKKNFNYKQSSQFSYNKRFSDVCAI
jgi:hypothetical protein